jgi:hypothetical protein
MEALLMPRDDPSVFAVFSEHFVSCVVGQNLYKAHAAVDRFSTYVSVSSEAYTMAYLENSYDHWFAEAKDAVKDEASRALYPKTKWTSENQAATIFKGWKKPGIDKYNELQTFVKGRRKSNEWKKLEKDLLASNEIIANAKKSGKKKVEVVEEEPEVLLIFSSDEEADSDEDDDEGSVIGDDDDDADIEDEENIVDDDNVGIEDDDDDE